MNFDNNIRKSAMYIALISAVMCGHSALAQPFEGGRHQGPPPGMFGGGDIEHMAEMLDLTDTQKSTIESIHQKYEDAWETAMDNTRAARDSLESAVNSDTFDESAIRAAHKEFASADVELAVLRGQIASEVRAVLTDEQRAKDAHLRSQRRR